MYAASNARNLSWDREYLTETTFKHGIWPIFLDFRYREFFNRFCRSNELGIIAALLNEIPKKLLILPLIRCQSFVCDILERTNLVKRFVFFFEAKF